MQKDLRTSSSSMWWETSSRTLMGIASPLAYWGTGEHLTVLDHRTESTFLLTVTWWDQSSMRWGWGSTWWDWGSVQQHLGLMWWDWDATWQGCGSVRWDWGSVCHKPNREKPTLQTATVPLTPVELLKHTKLTGGLISSIQGCGANGALQTNNRGD